MDKTDSIGFCEGCGLDIITVDMWYDVPNRLCYECAEYSEESASETESEVYDDEYEPDSTDSEIDDPTWRPPKRYRVDWSDNSSDDDDDVVSGEVDRVGSF